jgi:hypothetical protein
VRENIKKLAAIVNKDTGRAHGIRQMQQAVTHHITLEVIRLLKFCSVENGIQIFYMNKKNNSFRLSSSPPPHSFIPNTAFYY